MGAMIPLGPLHPERTVDRILGRHAVTRGCARSDRYRHRRNARSVGALAGWHGRVAASVVLTELGEDYRAQFKAAGAGERRFRALVQSSSDVVLLVDVCGTVLYMSHLRLGWSAATQRTAREPGRARPAAARGERRR